MKIVMVIDKELPMGLVANAAAVLGLSAGKLQGGIVGEDIPDCDGNLHLGITTKAIPILEGSKEHVKMIRERLFEPTFAAVDVIDFTELAQRSLDYDDYAGRLQKTAATDLQYLGLCLIGPPKKVNKLTGNLPLLR